MRENPVIDSVFVAFFVCLLFCLYNFFYFFIRFFVIKKIIQVFFYIYKSLEMPSWQTNQAFMLIHEK